MNIYLVTRNDKYTYDDYDVFVAAGTDEEQVKNMHPSGNGYYNNTNGHWQYYSDNTYMSGEDDWTNPKHTTVELIGIADKSIKLGVICASFNAG